MTDRDLAADLHFIYCDGIGHPKRGLCHDMADRLIALGWHIHGENVAPCAAHGITHHMFACDGLEERLARAHYAAFYPSDGPRPPEEAARKWAAAIAKAYREDAG